MFSFSQYGDWARAGTVLRGLSQNMTKAFKITVDRNGRMLQKRLVGHIDAQDLKWVPLAPSTVKKKGHSKIYIETGSLKNGILVRRISAPSYGYSLYIGCNPWTRNKDGVKLSDIMIYLEYGTMKIPARPLVRPTWKEVRAHVKEEMRRTLRGLVRGEIGG